MSLDLRQKSVLRVDGDLRAPLLVPKATGSGPARLEGDTLVSKMIPARAKFPARVLVSAFQ